MDLAPRSWRHPFSVPIGVANSLAHRRHRPSDLDQNCSKSHFYTLLSILKMKLFTSSVLSAVCFLPWASSFAPSSRKPFLSTELGASVVNGRSMSSSSLPKDPTVAAVPKIAQRWRKSTKQLVTLGPASDNKEMIEKLFLAGADVFRLNFSHGSQEQKKELLDTIREVEEKYSHPICVLGDLQGPKLRVGEFSKEFEILEKGQTFRLDLDEAKGDNKRVMLPHPEILEASEVGHTLLVDDGKVSLTVIKKGDKYVDTRVDVPGKISNRKVRIF